MMLRDVNLKAGTSITGIEVVRMKNIPNVLSPIMVIRVKRDYQAIYKYGNVIVILKDVNDRLLPDETVIELAFSDKESTAPRFRDLKLIPDYLLSLFNRLDQSNIENLQKFEPLDPNEVERIVNENELIAFQINSPIEVDIGKSDITLFNWEIRKVK